MDKTIIVNTMTVDCFYVEKYADEYVVIARANDDDLTMAKYKKEEEAKKTLEKLFVAYSDRYTTLDFSSLEP